MSKSSKYKSGQTYRWKDVKNLPFVGSPAAKNISKMCYIKLKNPVKVGEISTGDWYYESYVKEENKYYLSHRMISEDFLDKFYEIYEQKFESVLEENEKSRLSRIIED